MPDAPRARVTRRAAAEKQGSAAFDVASATTLQAPGGIAHEVGELHRLLVESVEDYAIFALDPDGYILSWNAGAQRFKGYRAEEVIGRHFSIFYPPERVAERFPQYELKEAARTGRFEDEGWRIRKDGSRFWANVVITALRDPKGNLVGYAKVTRDLTERRAAEEALRISEERFRLLVQAVKDYAIFMLDPKGIVTMANEGAQRIKGYTEQEIVGQHFSRFFAMEDIASGRPQRQLEIAASTGQYEEEGWRLRKNGSRFWASVLISAVRNPEGELIGFAQVTRDLTERRASQDRALEAAGRVAAEEAARRLAEISKERAERLQRLTSELSAARTVQDVAATVCKTGFAATGATAGALGLVDDPGECVRLVCDAGYAQLPERLRRMKLDDPTPMCDAVRSGRSIVFRSAADRDRQYPDMAPTLTGFTSTVVLPLEVNGRMIGAIAMHRSGTEPLRDDTVDFMKAVGQQVAQALDRARLYEAELRARTRADEANRAKSEFLAAMSHELRTPLNAIAGYADLLEMGLRGPVTDAQKLDLQRIKRSQEHLLGIINDILNFSKVEAGQTEYELEPVPLVEVLESVSHMIAPQVAKKGLTFQTGHCPREVVAWADRSKVEQILLNLLSNAVKFTDRGTVELTCDLTDEDQVWLSVKDSGHGIPADQLDKIFEPFVQVGRSLSATREGTGLGLAISRDLARAMSGDVRATSTEGQGSIFTLFLPRSTEPVGKDAKRVRVVR
jgi:PAS domain S-box-containing protein